jgi:hypothetical protein
MNELNDEITNLKEETIPKKDYVDLQSQFESDFFLCLKTQEN